MKRYFGIVACLVWLSGAHVGAQNDPLVGTWKLNLSKSMYDPGPAPQSSTQKYESVGKDSYKITRDSVDASGKATHGESRIDFDGKEHSAPNGAADSGSIMDRRIDTYNLEGMSMKAGKLTRVFFRFISQDGKTLTFKTLGVDGSGKWSSNVELFDRQ
jgi:hypothetical protein